MKVSAEDAAAVNNDYHQNRLPPGVARAYEAGKAYAENALAWRAFLIAAATFGAIGWLARGVFHGG